MKGTGLRVTSLDVAALAGVSQSAVSRAFTPGSPITEDKRSRILEAARKLNYVPNFIASSLTTASSYAGFRTQPAWAWWHATRTPD